jgi:membrane protease YdiL (CAAX protease family)
VTGEPHPTDSNLDVSSETGDRWSATTTESGSRERLSPGGYVAWLTVLLVTIGMVVLTAVATRMIAEKPVNEASAVDLLPIEMQGKMLVTQQSIQPAKPDNGDDEIDKTGVVIPAELDVGSYEQRLCYTILVNEFNGAEKAIEHLQTTDKRVVAADFELTGNQQTLRDTLGTLLDNYEAGNLQPANVDVEQEELMKERLGWIGNLALLPEGTPEVEQRKQLLKEASTTTITLVVGVIVGFSLMAAGLLVAIALFVLLVLGKLRSRFANRTTGQNIYIETFAIWMVLFFGVGQIGFPLMMSALGFRDEMLHLALMPLVFFASLIALMWPVFRGISFTQMRKDIGWTIGNPFAETASGTVAYIGLLPILFLAVIFVSLLMFLSIPPPSAETFSRSLAPSHPIQEYVADGGGLMMLFVVLTACVAAPIVEETMFRGVLYRHLRDATGGWQRWISIGFACLLNALIFASIHPQGALGIPMLMTLAIGFSLVREWRDSLLGPILMHGLNNLVVTSMLFFML